VKLGLPNAAQFLSMLRRMQGTGYSNDDDSARVAELDGVATVAARAAEALDEAVNNMFVSSAVEALDLLDRLFSMPSDATLTDAQRQSRLVAWSRALPKMLEARLDSALDSWLGTTTGATVKVSLIDAFNHRCTPLSHLAIGRVEPGATLATMRVIDAMLRRGMPARAASCKSGTRYAAFGQPTERSILRSDSFGGTPVPESRTAPNELLPAGVVTEEVMKEIQATLLWKPFRGGTCTLTNHFSVDHEDNGAMFYAEGSIAPLTQIALEDSGMFDSQWNHRVMQAWIVMSDAPFTDTTAVGLDHGWTSAVKTSGVTVYEHNFVGSPETNDIVLTLAANALNMRNDNATDTYYFKMFARRTPRVYQDTTHHREPWASPETFDGNIADAMARDAYIRNPTTPAYANIVAPGNAVRRILYTGAMQRTAGGDTPNLVVLDSSIDWRNRALLVTPLVGNAAVVKEASSTQIQQRIVHDSTGSPSGPTLTYVFLTSTGASANPTTKTAHQFAMRAGSSIDMWLWADSSTGYLMCEMKPSLSTNAYACGMIMVSATSALGTPSEPLPVFPLMSVVPSTQVLPADYNLAQDWGCYAQGQSAVGALVTAPPLGTIVDGGLPARPVAWLVRARDGYEHERLREVRQPIYGQRRRLVSLGVAVAQTIEIDAFSAIPLETTGNLDQMDYRDRFVSIEGCWSASDISLGRSPQLEDNPVVHFQWIFYAGPYGNQSIVLPGSGTGMVLEILFGRNGTAAFQSRIRITNNDSAARYFNLAIETTGFLGLTDRRMDGAVA
jgi:hypothetical protein